MNFLVGRQFEALTPVADVVDDVVGARLHGEYLARRQDFRAHHQPVDASLEQVARVEHDGALREGQGRQA